MDWRKWHNGFKPNSLYFVSPWSSPVQRLSKARPASTFKSKNIDYWIYSYNFPANNRLSSYPSSHVDGVWTLVTPQQGRQIQNHFIPQFALCCDLETILPFPSENLMVQLHGVLGKPIMGRDPPSISELIHTISPLEYSSSTHPRTCTSIIITYEGLCYNLHSKASIWCR